MNTNTNRRQFLAGAIGTGAVLTLSSGELVFAKGKKGAKKGKAKDEFVSLFNGENLDGWHTNKKEVVHGTGGKWQVVDGAITGEQDTPGNGGILMSDKQYGDFELVVDMNHEWGADSGVFLRTNEDGECFQVYADYHDHGLIGWISTETPSGEKRMIIRPFNIFGKFDEKGVLTGFETKPDEREAAWKPDYLKYCATPEQWLAAWKLNDWNTIRIRCVGEYPQITTWLNDVKLAEFDGATCPQPNYDKELWKNKLGRKGAIGLQVHGGNKYWTNSAKCRWKNIRIKTL